MYPPFVKRATDPFSGPTGDRLLAQSKGELDVWAAVKSKPRPSGRRPREPKGIWSSVFDHIDLARYKPRLADHVEIKEFTLRWGDDYAIASNRRDLIFYRLEPGEADMLRSMDGSKTVGEIVVERLDHGYNFDLSSVADLVRQLEEGNFLDKPFIDLDGAVKKAIAPPPKIRDRLGQFTKTLTIEWWGAERLVRWFYEHGVKYFFNKFVQIPIALFVVAGLVAFLTIASRSNFKLLDRSAAREGLVLIGLCYSLTFIHEMAHASVFMRNNRRVRNAGFFIYFGSIAFFIDSTDSLMMDRRQRMLMSFAGPYSEMIVAGVASLAVFAFPELAISKTLYKFAVLNYYIVFLNLLPFLELDGYWIFSDLIQVPNLRKKSLDFMRYDLLHKIAARERFNLQQLGLGVYSMAGFAFTAFWIYASFYFWRRIFGGIISALWDGGLFTRVLLVVLAIILLGPVIRGLIGLVRKLFKKLRNLAETVQFRLQTGWRVEAAELVESIPMFEQLDTEALEDLAGRVKLIKVPAGKPIVRQGTIPDAFYVVRHGTLRVIEENPQACTERALRTLGRGESFGELGLVKAAPRAATVRALEDSEVFEINKEAFDRLLSDLVEVENLEPTFQAAAELRGLKGFAHLEPDELLDLLKFGEWRNMKSGEVIVRQGQPADSFYALGAGQVEVLRSGRRISTLGAGDYFGEIGLLMDIPRTATVRAITPIRVFSLNRRGFNRLVRRAFKRGTLNPQTPIRRMWEH